jgi:hypothetical protein
VRRAFEHSLNVFNVHLIELDGQLNTLDHSSTGSVALADIIALLRVDVAGKRTVVRVRVRVSLLALVQERCYFRLVLISFNSSSASQLLRTP